MYTNLQVHEDSETSSDAQNIQTAPKHWKLISGASYRNAHFLDENRELLHLANCNIASSSHNPRTIMVIIIVWYINVIISMSNQLIMHCRRAY